LSIEIEELTRLVEEEKAAEDKVKRARDKAEEILKRAREHARQRLLEAEASLSPSEYQLDSDKDFEKVKSEITRAYQDRINSLNRLAERNFERAVQMIVEKVMEVKVWESRR
jgi:vacuolar-type H+-ATPase subunit H